MCGCSGSLSSKASTSTTCGWKSSKLEDARNKIAILFNSVSDPQLKEEYKALREEIEQILLSIYNNGACPDGSVVNAIINEIENEYANYYNP
jgi:hypothetical protein